jgi:hypothetical protein
MTGLNLSSGATNNLTALATAPRAGWLNTNNTVLATRPGETELRWIDPTEGENPRQDNNELGVERIAPTFIPEIEAGLNIDLENALVFTTPEGLGTSFPMLQAGEGSTLAYIYDLGEDNKVGGGDDALYVVTEINGVTQAFEASPEQIEAFDRVVNFEPEDYGLNAPDGVETIVSFYVDQPSSRGEQGTRVAPQVNPTGDLLRHIQ